MTTINFDFEDKALRRSLGKLEDGLQNRAVIMAINKVVPKCKTESVRAITAEFNLKQAEVRPRIKLDRARRGKLQGEINPFASASKKGRSLNIIHFMEGKVTLAEGRRRKKAGTQNQLRFKIKKRGGVKTIKGAFIGNKGRTVFQRTGKERLPIKAVSTIDVPQMFNTKSIIKRIVARGEKELPIEYGRAARILIKRFNR